MSAYKRIGLNVFLTSTASFFTSFPGEKKRKKEKGGGEKEGRGKKKGPSRGRPVST